jgi:hypothetical protein
MKALVRMKECVLKEAQTATAVVSVIRTVFGTVVNARRSVLWIGMVGMKKIA